MKRSNQGFTLVEIMIVFVILAVIVAISYLAFQQGVRREYSLSQQARSLATALQLARVQALDNKTAIQIQVATSSELTGSWYKKIQITAPNHGVTAGDYVAISGLHIVGSGGTETPTTGAYYVSDVANDSTFQCVYYHSDSMEAIPGAVARNLTRASQLIIAKKSWVDSLSTDEKEAKYKSSQYFIYDDGKFLVWDQADEGVFVDTTATDPSSFSSSDYRPSPGFTSRGFAASESGNELRLMAVPIKPGNFKIVTITPFGQVMLGTTQK